MRRGAQRRVCRPWPQLAWVALAGALATSPASAEEALEIVLAQTSTLAPTVVVATASTASVEPFVAYRWGPFGEHPRCRHDRCEVDVPVAMCRSVSVEATTLLGATVTATRSFCADAPSGRPPSASIGVVRAAGQITATPTVETHGARIIRLWMWVDDRQVDPTEPATIAVDGGCHVVDLVAVDAEGRLGLDHRSLCTGADAPRVWLGSSEGLCPSVGVSHEVCSEVDHPLGFAVISDEGPVPANGCSDPLPAPQGVERRVMRVRDDSGALSYGSIVHCGAPASGAPVLFFADAPRTADATVEQALEVDVQLFGGEAPFNVEAQLGPDHRGRTQPAGATIGQSSAKVRVAEVANGPEQRQLVITIRDARGLQATAEVTVQVAGVTAAPPARGFSSNAQSAGCLVAARPDPMLPALILFAAFGLWRRRR